MTTSNFFEDPREQSLVKSEIVKKYFSAWSKIIIQTLKESGEDRLAYIDLFAGPGRYDDNTKSTPLLVLETAVENPDLSQMLVTIFNDKKQDNVASLENAILQIPNIDQLKFKPQIHNIEIDKTLVQQFENTRFIPTLLFVDPWGYKGLSLSLVNSVLKDWGCDCIFFFNYNRINMGLNNDKVKEHMDVLFGEERAGKLRNKLFALSAYDRELQIVEELSQAFHDYGYKYVLPFRFRNEKGNRTSHHLIFVTKSFRGYGIMKDIMAKESSSAEQGVPSFEYNPADITMPLLFELNRPIDELAGILLKEYANKTISFTDLYEEHSVGRRYIKRNYKDVLMQLENEGKIIANPPAPERRKNTFADHVVITFKNKP
ncbi:MAG: three-Cys-motif partner protein TcmP [Anaerolineaceae bacterium]|jgi:three-Cys-motif partner protein|nr:MAG: three-Cys-motif partner protein TcmP [Anaerolineaceae bacterium]